MLIMGESTGQMWRPQLLSDLATKAGCGGRGGLPHEQVDLDEVEEFSLFRKIAYEDRSTRRQAPESRSRPRLGDPYVPWRVSWVSRPELFLNNLPQQPKEDFPQFVVWQSLALFREGHVNVRGLGRFEASAHSGLAVGFAWRAVLGQSKT